MWRPDAEEKAKKKHEEDPKQKEFKGKQEDADRKRRYAEVGQCRLTGSKPVLKAPMVSATEAET